MAKGEQRKESKGKPKAKDKKGFVPFGKDKK